MTPSEQAQQLRTSLKRYGAVPFGDELLAAIEALEKISAPSVLLTTREKAEHALRLALEAGEHHSQALLTADMRRYDALTADMDAGLKKARTLLGLEEA